MSSIVPAEDEEGLELGTLVLFSMGEALAGLRKVTGLDVPVVKLGNGDLRIEEQDPGQPWRDRLVRLLDAARFACESGAASDPGEASEAILRADGWTWTPFTFRTPVWMDDHAEVFHGDIIEEFEVLSWLETYSSVTR